MDGRGGAATLYRVQPPDPANPYAGTRSLHPPGTFDNPYGTSATSPKPYDPDSVANPYGR